MDRDIFLDYRVGQMTSEDSVISVAICFAPYDEILPLVTGIFRAINGPSIVIDGEHESPHELYKRDQAYASKSKAQHLCPFWGITVAEPKGTEGITLVEHWAQDEVFDTLGKLRSDMASIIINSHFENKACLEHMFSIEKGTKSIRYVSLSRNMDSTGWLWEEDGEPQPWEDITHYKDRATSRRLDRDLLFKYAKTHGVDLQACLAHRQFKRSAFIKSLSLYDPDDNHEPTKFGQAAYEAALRAGIGEPDLEQSAAERQVQAAMMQKCMEISDAALEKVNKSKSIDDIEAALQSAKAEFESSQQEQETYQYLMQMALQTARRIDMNNPSTRRLERELIKATENSDWPVRPEDIEGDRADLKHQTMLQPLAELQARFQNSSDEPNGMLQIMHSVLQSGILETDLNLRRNFTREAYAVACRLDINSKATEEMGRALNDIQSQIMGRKCDPASDIRNEGIKLKKQREAAARKRAEKASKPD